MKKFLKKLCYSVLVCVFFTLLVVGLVGCKGCNNNQGNSEPVYNMPSEEAIPALRVDKPEIKNLTIGDTATLLATYTALDGKALTWSSSNPEVASVSAMDEVSATVCAIQTGETTITATYGDLTAKCEVTVSNNNIYPVLTFEQNIEDGATILLEDKLDVNAYVSFNGKRFDDAQITYTVGDESYGSVDKNERVFASGRKLGSTTITVSATWRNIQSELLTKTISVEMVSNRIISLNNGKLQEINLYTVSELNGNSYRNTQVLDKITVLENGNTVDNYTISVTDNISGYGSNDAVAEYDSATKTVKALAYGTAKLVVSFETENGLYTQSFPITVTRPVENYTGANIEYFSILDGELPTAEIFANTLGGNTILDAYQGDSALKVVDGKIFGVVSSNEKNMSVETITVYNEKIGYILNVETYQKVLRTEEDLKCLNSVNTVTIRGYYYVANDITNISWNGIFTQSSFSGVLEGNGHTIEIPNAGGGFFGVFLGTVKNINLIVKKVGIYQNYSTPISKNCLQGLFENVNIIVDAAGVQKGLIEGFAIFGAGNKNLKMRNVVIDVPSNITVNPKDTLYGLMFRYDTQAAMPNYAANASYASNFQNVYVISPTLKRLVNRGDSSEQNNYNAYAGNDIELYEADTAENKWYYGGIKRFDTVADMAAAGNNYAGFNSAYWIVSNGMIYWKPTYTENVNVVATDENGALTNEYELMSTTDSLTFTLFDNEELNDVTVTVMKGADNLIQNGNKISLLNAPTEDVTYIVVLKATVRDVEITKTVNLKVLLATTTYADEILFDTTDDTFIWGKDGSSVTLPAGITKAYINGTEITVSEGKLPDITMKYIKKYTTYGRVKTTYMDIYAGESLIVFEKAEDTTIGLRLITPNGAHEYTNVLVATKVLTTAKDLEMFSINNTYLWKNGYYVLGKNIDATDTVISHVSISTYAQLDKAFTGTFDGRGYTISNLNAAVESAKYENASGLFGILHGATVRNVAFVNVNIQNQSLFGYSIGYFPTATNPVTNGAFTSDPSMFPYVKNSYAYANNVIDNVYIKVADSVTKVEGVLFEGGHEMAQARITNVLVEWMPTDVAATGKFSGATLDNKNKTYSNIVVISPAIDIGTYTFVTKYAASSAAADVAFTAFNNKYWTIPEKGVPVWKTA